MGDIFLLLNISSTFSKSRLGWSHSEKFKRSRACVILLEIRSETGAIRLYHGQAVSLLWQSKQARSARRRVSGESQRISANLTADRRVCPIDREELNADQDDEEGDHSPFEQLFQHKTSLGES